MRSPYIYACSNAVWCIWVPGAMPQQRSKLRALMPVTATVELQMLAAESMSAVTDLAADMRFGATLRASLLPALANGLLGFWLGRPRCSKFQNPGFIRLFDRALRMNTSQGVSRFSADWAKMF